MYIKRIESTKLSDEQKTKIIEEYTSLGWRYEGINNFPPTCSWLSFVWEKNDNPQYPQASQAQKR